VRVIASSKVNSYSITTKLIVKISGKKKRTYYKSESRKININYRDPQNLVISKLKIFVQSYQTPFQNYFVITSEKLKERLYILCH
jgi:hypothetical protein